MATKSQAKKSVKAKADAKKAGRFFAITAICVLVLLLILFVIFNSL